MVAEAQGVIVGAIGLEIFGTAALLRSAVVDHSQRGSGIGRELVTRIIAEARSAGVNDLYLLTTTAEDYFSRLGFSRIDRALVPEAFKTSAEFQGACPASASAMQKRISSASDHR